MRSHFAIILSITLAALFLIGCKSRVVKETAQPETIVNIPPSASELALAEASNQFAFDMYRVLVEQDKSGGNIVFSPFSNFVVLAMVGEGAQGQTADEIWTALHLQDQPGLADSALPQMLQRLEKLANADTLAILETANALFSSESPPIRPEYRNWFTENCLGKYFSISFSTSSLTKTVDRINKWVSEKTHGKIPSLLNPKDISGGTTAVLVNTLYFEGKWKNPFNKKLTSEEWFYTLKGDSLRVNMMQSTKFRNSLRVLNNDSFQWVELPYKNDRFVMQLLLPRERTGMRKYDSTLTWQKWNQLSDSLTLQNDVFVQMPRQTISLRMYMMDILTKMGVHSVFMPGVADLSRMYISRGPWVDKVIHAVKIEVDETGTVAAAATAIFSVTCAQPDPVIIRLDHPFFFTITDKQNGAILFMGHIVKPVE